MRCWVTEKETKCIKMVGGHIIITFKTEQAARSSSVEEHGWAGSMNCTPLELAKPWGCLLGLAAGIWWLKPSPLGRNCIWTNTTSGFYRHPYLSVSSIFTHLHYESICCRKTRLFCKIANQNCFNILYCLCIKVLSWTLPHTGYLGSLKFCQIDRLNMASHFKMSALIFC